MFFGMPGSGNDINVLENSPLLDKIAAGTYPRPLQYMIAGEQRNKPYWFADGIYPKYPCFVLPDPHPTNKKEQLFSATQESIRKEVERAFARLQNKWHILSRASRFWSRDHMKTVVQCCVILHNMSIDMDWAPPEGISGAENAGESTSVTVGDSVEHMWRQANDPSSPIAPGSIAAICMKKAFTADVVAHIETKRLLVEHLWIAQGSK